MSCSYKDCNRRPRALSYVLLDAPFVSNYRKGIGFLERVYKKYMVIELRKEGLNAKTEKGISVFYGNEAVGEFYADILIKDTVIAELKSIGRIIQAHEIQLMIFFIFDRQFSIFD